MKEMVNNNNKIKKAGNLLLPAVTVVTLTCNELGWRGWRRDGGCEITDVTLPWFP